MSRALLLYGTDPCELCERARALVEPVADAFGWRLVCVDVAEDDVLFERWGEQVPVLARSDRERALGWPFDHDAVLAYLSAP